ncbi:MAG: hypothetical protein DMG65_18495 [Candidatus Angelobacter sp. Gp1-AA117]|nr:MAG: hypothetical protein DMG65_18495 [Candidatus Angelobacter sp. Gp1-AA117]
MGGQQRGRFLHPTHALKKTRVSLTGVRNDISHGIQHGAPKVSDISRGRLRSIKILGGQGIQLARHTIEKPDA